MDFEVSNAPRMHKLPAALVVGYCFLIGGMTSHLEAQKPMKRPDPVTLPFYLYHGYKSPANHYTPSGWMGDYGDLRFNDNWQGVGISTHPVIRIFYSARASQGAGWAGIYWQHPPNNWGSTRGGYNLRGARRLAFQARGRKGGEVISHVKVGGIARDYPDTAEVTIGPIKLTRHWRTYAVYLRRANLRRISGGLCLTMKRDANPRGATIYLDNIRYE
jgi:hypothetical protein